MVVVDVDDVFGQEQASQTMVFAGGSKMSLMMMDSHSVNWGSEINDNPNLLSVITYQRGQDVVMVVEMASTSTSIL